MKNFKTKIAILAISFVSFLGIQTASAVEGLTLGFGVNYSGFMGKGKEVMTGSGAATTQEDITEEDGAFDATVPTVFAEYSFNDAFSLGVEYVAEDMETPQNTNVQDTLTNSVRADFKDHTTVYANINMPFNTYLKLGYVTVDVATADSLETGGAYPDVDTSGMTVGLGYQHSAGDGMFIRAELSATEYDNVDATNTNDSAKK